MRWIWGLLQGLSKKVILKNLLQKDSVWHFSSILWYGDSSGDKVNRFGITKAGNSHLRRLLVEAAQSYTRGNVGHKSIALKQRQKILSKQLKKEAN